MTAAEFGGPTLWGTWRGSIVGANLGTVGDKYARIFHYHPAGRILVSEVLNVDTILDCLS